MSSLAYRKHGFPRGDIRSLGLGGHNGHGVADLLPNGVSEHKEVPGLEQGLLKFAFKGPVYQTMLGDVRDERSTATGPDRPVEKLWQARRLRFAPF
jgi:hypothetical protein